MPLKFQCPCGTKLVVSARYAGRRVKCPKCSESLEVPDGPEESVAKGLGVPEVPRSAISLKTPSQASAPRSSGPTSPRPPAMDKKTLPSVPRLRGDSSEPLAADLPEVEPPPIQVQARPGAHPAPNPTPPIDGQPNRNQEAAKGSEPHESTSPAVHAKKADPAPLDAEPKPPVPCQTVIESRREAKQSVVTKKPAAKRSGSKARVPPTPPPLPNTKPAEASSAIAAKSTPDQKERPSIAQQSKTSERKNQDSKREERKSEAFKTAVPNAKTEEAKKPKNKKPNTRKLKAAEGQAAHRRTEDVKPQPPEREESQAAEHKTQEASTDEASTDEEPSTDEPKTRPSIAKPLKGDRSSSKPRPLQSREKSVSAQTDERSPASKSNDSNTTSGRNVDTKSSTRHGKGQPAATRGSARPPLPPGKEKGREIPNPVRPSKTKTTSPITKPATPSSGTAGIKKAVSSPVTPNPAPDPTVAKLPGYEATEDQVAIVRAIGISLAAVAAISSIPAIMDIIDHIRAEASLGVARWAYLVLMLATLQVAYAAYVFQLPDWSTVWVVTIVTLVISTGYAMLLGLTLITNGDAWLVSLLDLGDAFRGGRVSVWCFVMLCLTSLVSYFSGRISVRWRGELTAT